jgi:alpha-tubulin suppressor-like RCC1 family protein
MVYRFGVVGNQSKIAQLELGAPAVVGGISGDIVQIATSNSDGYALTSTGEVWAWGVASYGELGDGQTAPYDTRAVRVDFPAGVKIVWGWGLNATGDLCLSGLLQLRPARLPLSDVTLATGARTHSLFYSGGKVYACGSTGEVWAWGGNQNGQLGAGSGTLVETNPVDVGIHLTQVSSTASNVAGLDQRGKP